MPQTNNTFANTATTKGLRLACYCLLLLLLTAPTLWAQRTNVIDNKGTIKSVGNTVTTAATAPTAPMVDDIWFDTTLTGDERTKVWDGTAWKEISPDYIELWVNNTNGGSYATNDLVAYNGHIYRNISGTNLDTTPDSDTTNWKNIDTYLGYKTTRHTTTAALAVTDAAHNLTDLHLESTGDLTMDKAGVSDGTSLYITNTTANDRSLSFTDFAGTYLRNGGTITDLTTSGLTLKANTRYLVHITDNSGDFYFNATEAASPWYYSSRSTAAINVIGTGAVATQSSTYTTDIAANAIDGNLATTQRAMTDFQVYPWLKVDMGSSQTFNRLRFHQYGHTFDRLSNFYVFFSDSDIVFPAAPTAADLTALQADVNVSFIQKTGTIASPFEDLSFAAKTARYMLVVRDISTADYLQMTEVQAFNNIQGDTVTTDADVVKVTGTLELDGALHDINNSAGSNGQILTSTGSGTNWVDLSTVDSYLGYKTVHNGASALAITHADHNLVDLHLEGAGDLSITKADVTGATTLFITNTTANDRNLTFTDFAGAYLRNGGTEKELKDIGLTLKANTRYLVHITDNSGDFYFNATEAASPWYYSSRSTAAINVIGTGAVATQSSTYTTDIAANAIDGNLATTQRAMTDFQVYPWLKVDMGSSQTFNRLRFHQYGHTFDRLSNFYVFFSDSDIVFPAAPTAADLTALQADVNVSFIQKTGTIASPFEDLSFAAKTARYMLVVRDISTADYLQMTEVQAFNNIQGDTVTTDADVVKVTGTLELDGALHDINNSAGSNSQILTSTGSGTNWVDSSTVDSYLGYKTVHNGASALAITHADHNLVDLHLEGAGDLSIDSAAVTGATTLFITNTTANDRALAFTNFMGAYLRNGGIETELKDIGLTLKANTRYLVHITDNSGDFYFNATEAGGGIDEGTATANTLYWNGTDWVESTALQNDGTDVRITGALKDSSGDAGNTGQILSSTASGTNWISGQDGIENWALANAYAANDVVIHNNKIYQANGAVAASTTFTLGTTGATWKEISKSGNSITNELSFEDTAGTYFYVSLLVDNAWKVIRYKLDDVNDEKTATQTSSTNNNGQTTQPNTLALCETLTYN